MKTIRNYVFNHLEIICKDEIKMAKIKDLLIKENCKKDNLSFTMEKFLPKPASDTKTYVDDWCRSVWGTAHDVHDSIIAQKEGYLSIRYATDWHSNLYWVHSLLRFVDKMSHYGNFMDVREPMVKYKYFELAMDKGYSTVWIPGYDISGTNYKSLTEFAKCIEFDDLSMLVDKKKEFRSKYGEVRYIDFELDCIERGIPISKSYNNGEYDDLPF